MTVENLPGVPIITMPMIVSGRVPAVIPQKFEITSSSGGTAGGGRRHGVTASRRHRGAPARGPYRIEDFGPCRNGP
ncbi:hypothetical protein Pta02_77250 [Planobispora takensis]|uniref:Uncharacterized protein n=1 Tax=Planobispora takensis TaxID=1367882 RepID=A0A8J3T445_9ACTN|nr:hypothetical protein Pta02_77250 [Planobispora takensis]